MDNLKSIVTDYDLRYLLFKGGITSVHDLFVACNDELLHVGLSLSQIAAVKLSAAKSFNLQIVNALDIKSGKAVLCGDTFISTGCPKLDKFLHGGIRIGGITEVAGESGSGKTQLCLQLCLAAQFPNAMGGSDGGVVYICTTGPFPSTRLDELATTFVPAAAGVNAIEALAGKCSYGDNVHINSIDKIDVLLQCVSHGLPLLLESTSNIRLIIVDSIAGIFASCNLTAKARAEAMQVVGTKLHALSQMHKVAILITNQVSATNKGSVGGQFENIASLGLAWTNMVSTRLMTFNYLQHLKTLKIIFSPYLASSQCMFEITRKGVFGLEN